MADPIILAIEGGAPVEVAPEFVEAYQNVEGRLARVQGADGQWYDHVADADDGTWIFRNTNGR